MPHPSEDPNNKYEAFVRLLEGRRKAQFSLCLYVVGLTLNSIRAINNITTICEQELPGRYDLEVVDVSKQPSAAWGDQVVAAPTLIKKWPLPLRRLIGDMSDKERVIRGLGLTPKT